MQTYRAKTEPKIRRFKPSFIEFGFVKCGNDEHKPEAICVICQDVLANSSLNPAKLSRHLHQRHSTLKTRPKHSFQLAAKDLARMQQNLVSRPSGQANEVSLRLSYEIGRAGEAQTIGERLIKPCLLQAAQCLFSARQVKQIAATPLSNNTVCLRIADASAWLERLQPFTAKTQYSENL